jgi:hypothetical protein
VKGVRPRPMGLLLLLLGGPALISWTACDSLGRRANSAEMTLRTGGAILGLNRRQRRQHLQPPGAPVPPPAAPATNLERASFAGVEEDHAYEQYFFDAETRTALLALIGQFERPLLLCTPSLAVDADAAGLTFVLLDRDERTCTRRQESPSCPWHTPRPSSAP